MELSVYGICLKYGMEFVLNWWLFPNLKVKSTKNLSLKSGIWAQEPQVKIIFFACFQIIST